MIEINKHWFYAIATIFSLGVSENVYPTNVHAKANYLRRTENNVSTNSVAKQNSTNEISGVVGSVNYTIDNGTLTLSQGSIDRTNSSDNNPFNDPVYPWTNNNCSYVKFWY